MCTALQFSTERGLPKTLFARMASEQLVTGSLWYDELRITRAANAERPWIWPAPGPV